MKRLIFSMLLTLSIAPPLAFAGEGEPTVYIIQKGDTLWGLSNRFVSDPYYWPNLWAGNPTIGNPHFIYPGQKVRIHPDRIEIVPRQDEASAVAPAPATAAASLAAKAPAEDVIVERSFTVSGGEGFLLEKDIKPSGYIITTNQNRYIVGEDDIVYTDIGTVNGAKVGDRFSIFKKAETISHPESKIILGEKVIPLGTLQLTEVESKVSKALIIKSYQEVAPGSYLLPYRERRKEIPLRAAEKDLNGYIVATKTGNSTVGPGDIVYTDLGRKQGVVPGNFLYILRDVKPDQMYASHLVRKLPPEVIGAMVVVSVSDNTSTALVVKSIDAIYRGDRFELKKSK